MKINRVKYFNHKLLIRLRLLVIILTRRLTRRCFVESEYLRHRGWARMSRNHVFVCGPKYTIFYQVVEKCPYLYSLIIRVEIGDILLRCGEMGENVGKSRNLGLTLTPPGNLFGEPPKFQNQFWILLFRACC